MVSRSYKPPLCQRLPPLSHHVPRTEPREGSQTLPGEGPHFHWGTER